MEPFRLDDVSASRPSRFAFYLLIDEVLYGYRFAVTSESVVDESLARTRAKTEKVLYKRKHGEIEFDPSLSNRKLLEFAFKTTRANQLFLTNSVSLGLKTFACVYTWFDDYLELIDPDSRFAPFEHLTDDISHHNSRIEEAISQLDIEFYRIDTQEVSLEKILPNIEPVALTSKSKSAPS